MLKSQAMGRQHRSVASVKALFPPTAILLFIFSFGLLLGGLMHRPPPVSYTGLVQPFPAASRQTLPTDHQEPADHALYFIAPLLELTEKTTERQVRAVHTWTQLSPRPHIQLATENVSDFNLFTKLLAQREPKLPRSAMPTRADVTWITFDDPHLIKIRLPTLNSLFQAMFNQSKQGDQTLHPIYTYVNSDIFLFEEFGHAARNVAEMAGFRRYLMVGERMELWLNESTRSLPARQLRQAALDSENYRGRWAIDYFTFGPETWHHIPNFVIGRPRFDNWLVANARGVRVDATDTVMAMHTIHDYTHAGANETIREDFKSPIIEEMNPGRQYNEHILETEAKNDEFYRNGSLDHFCLKIRASRSKGFCYARSELPLIKCSEPDRELFLSWKRQRAGKLCTKEYA